MTQTEFDCINRIRYAMKMHLRWDYWSGDDDRDGCYEGVLDAMNYLVDVLWDKGTSQAWVLT